MQRYLITGYDPVSDKCTIKEINPELPLGYDEACEKYASADDLFFPSDGSIADIWDRLEDWHKYEKWKGKMPPARLKEFEDVVEEFKAQILAAVFDGDRVYLANLLKAIDRPTRPQTEMNGIRAAIKAFDDLFCAKGLQSKDDWPTKQEVRRRAEEILKEAGHWIPTERHWPRIFNQAGLWQLLSVKRGPARRAKKPDSS